MEREGKPPPSGMGVDSSGGPVVDPTRNVLDLVYAAVTRQDDLRALEAAHIREIIVLRAEERANEIRNLQVLEGMRAEHAKELRDAEAERINAIREVDNQAVQRAAEVSTQQASTLATQVAQAAEAMRVQVAATATASATSLATALEPIIKAVEDLRRAQYEAQGQKTQVVETQSKGVQQSSWALVAIGIGGLVLTIVLIFASVAIATHGFTK